MFTSESTIKNITNRLTHIAAYTKTLAKANLNDSAVISENFFAGLINLIYGFDLTNSNNFKRNCEAIDLHSIENKVCVQVTIRQDREKYNETISKYIKNKYYEKYDKLYIFVLGYKEKLNKDFDTRGLFTFDHKEHIISLHEIIPIISTLDNDKQREIDKYIEKEFLFPLFFIEEYTEQHFSQEIWAYVEAVYQNSHKCVVPEFLGRYAMNPKYFYRLACDSLDNLKAVLSKRKIFISSETNAQIDIFIKVATLCLDKLRIFSANHDPKDMEKMKFWYSADQSVKRDLWPSYEKATELLRSKNINS